MMQVSIHLEMPLVTEEVPTLRLGLLFVVNLCFSSGEKVELN